MTRLLCFDASSRVAGFRSRRLADHPVRRLEELPAGVCVLGRDLAADPLPIIESATIRGFYTPAGPMADDLRAAKGEDT